MIDDSQIQRFKPLLDFIAEHEGTADEPGGGYDTSLGYGRYIEGGEQTLTDKTLEEIDRLQTGMLNRTDNSLRSSALGRYQIIRTTLRGLKKELRLSPTERYTPQLQDWLAVRLIKRRGRSPYALRQEWEGLKKATDRAILAAYDDDGRGDDARSSWRERADDPNPSSTSPVESSAFPIRRGSNQKALITALQEGLAQRQYFVGTIDGIYGPLTRGAVATFQVEYDLQPPVYGEVDEATWNRLETAGPRPLSSTRLDTTANDLRRDGSTTISNADRARLAGIVMAVLGALGIGNAALGGQSDPAISAKVLYETIANAKPDDLKVVLPSRTPPEPIIQNAIAAAPAAPSNTGQSTNGVIEQAVIGVADIFFPHVGGGIATLALGLLTSLFSTRIIDRRVADQRTGRNIGPMKTGNRQS